MLSVELVRCSECGRIFGKKTGGVIKGVANFGNLCTICKLKYIKNIFKK